MVEGFKSDLNTYWLHSKRYQTLSVYFLIVYQVLQIRGLSYFNFLFGFVKTNFPTFTFMPLCESLFLIFWSMIGAVCVGPRAVGMSLLETWSSALHVLPHPSSTKTVD